MFFSISQIGIARLACRGFLLACCLMVAVGCNMGKRHAAKHVEVSGKVTYKGKPVTGGRITFVTSDGFSSSGIIDENGNYKVSAPVGSVKISVDNRMLLQPIREAAKQGAGPRPGGEEPNPIKGTYRPIPSKYYVPDTSPLSYTVTSEPQQTFDVALTD
jgi:hypothetical protein